MGKKVIVASVGLLLLVAIGVFVAARMLLDPDAIRQTVETRGSAVLREPVQVGTASVSLWPRAGVTLTNVEVGQPASLTLARVDVSTAMRALLSRRVEDADIVVEDSQVELPKLLAVVNRLGVSSGSAAPGAGAASALTLVNVRSIAFRNVSISAGGRTAVFDLQSSLHGDRLEITNASVRSDVTTLEASGTIDSIAGRKAALQLSADPLDLDGLMVFAGEFAKAAGGGGSQTTAAGGGLTGGPLDVTLAIKAARGRAAGVQFENLAATARLTPEGMAFEPIGFGVFGGRLDGTLKADLRSAEPTTALAGKIGGVDMTRVTQFAGYPGAVTGTLGGTFSVTGSGLDPSRALANAKGRGQMAITDGAMKGLELVRTIVLAFGKPNLAQPAGSGEAFSRLGGSFSLAGGVVSSQDLSFVSRDVELSGRGTLRLAGGWLDVDAVAMLSRELTAQAGRDLVRYTAVEGRVTVPADVGGTVSSPTVTPDMASLTSRAVTNEIKRQTDSLIKGLLNRKKPPS